LLHPLIEFLLNEGGFDKEAHGGWKELAERFGLSSEDAAFGRWKRFLGTDRGLEFKSATFNKDGEVVSTKVGRAPERPEMPPVNDEDWVWQTRDNKTGGGWTHYKNSKAYGLSELQVDDVTKKLSRAKFSAKKRDGTGIGIVDISDLHTGAVLKYASETIKTPEFDIAILTDYIAEAAAIINEYKFKEVHLFLPGDIVETFTAFNHRDSWKHVQAFQGGVTIIAYQVIKNLITSLANVKCVYMVEGNHDRLTADKEGNSRKGIAEIIAYFLKENGQVGVKYHPWMIAEEIDGMYHICTHGDHKPFLKNDFWFRYGKQGMYNILRTGHYHGFNVLRQT